MTDEVGLQAASMNACVDGAASTCTRPEGGFVNEQGYSVKKQARCARTACPSTGPVGRCERVDQQAQAPVQLDEFDEVYKQAHSLDKLGDMDEVD